MKPRASPAKFIRLVATPPLPTLVSSNLQDNIVVQMLADAELGSLPIDRFVGLLGKEASEPPNRLVVLRQGLIKVYGEAANRRRIAKASYPQIRSAQGTLRSLIAAIGRLDRIKPPGHRGLKAVFGGPLGDHKGIDEINDFAANCWQVKLALTKVVQELDRAVRMEMAKPSKASIFLQPLVADLRPPDIQFPCALRASPPRRRRHR